MAALVGRAAVCRLSSALLLGLRVGRQGVPRRALGSYCACRPPLLARTSEASASPAADLRRSLSATSSSSAKAPSATLR
eukprot:7147132-Karenia_brevis.AAC.1